MSFSLQIEETERFTAVGGMILVYGYTVHLRLKFRDRNTREKLDI